MSYSFLHAPPGLARKIPLGLLLLYQRLTNIFLVISKIKSLSPSSQEPRSRAENKCCKLVSGRPGPPATCRPTIIGLLRDAGAAQRATCKITSARARYLKVTVSRPRIQPNTGKIQENNTSLGLYHQQHIQILRSCHLVFDNPSLQHQACLRGVVDVGASLHNQAVGTGQEFDNYYANRRLLRVL